MRQAFLFLLFLFVFPISGYSQITPTTIHASSEESSEYSVSKLADNDLNTRWSSRFSDDQYVQFDLGQKTEIAGLTLFWEAAFAAKYKIFISNDKQTWTKVYEEDFGDGNIDRIFFKKSRARYVRLVFLKRGTAWGYSLFEVRFEAEKISVISSPEEEEEQTVFSGLYKDGFVFNKGFDQALTFRLPSKIRIAALDFYLESDAGEGFGVSLWISADGERWQQVMNGKKELHYQNNKTNLLRVRSAFKEQEITEFKIKVYVIGDEERVELREIRLKEYDDIRLSPLSLYKSAASEFKRGLYPLWLRDEQEYWTVTGMPDGENELAVSESGRIGNGVSYEWFIRKDSELLSWTDFSTTHSLSSGWMPIPEIDFKNDFLSIRQTVVCSSPGKKRSCAYSQLEIRNRVDSPQNFDLIFVIRPLTIHSDKHYAGFSPIHDLRIKDGAIFVDENLFSVVNVPEGKSLITTGVDGDCLHSISRGASFTSQELHKEDPIGMLSGAIKIRISLEGKETKKIISGFSLDGIAAEDDLCLTASEFQNKLSETTYLWENKLAHLKMDLPDDLFSNVFKANLVYGFLHKDGPVFQPGSRLYEKTWMRDGAMSCAAFLRAGFQVEVREYLNWIAGKQKENGFVPFLLHHGKQPDYTKDWNEYDSQGQFIYATVEYYRFSQDKDLLRSLFPNIKRSVIFIKKIIENDPLSSFYGLVKASNSHEGYFPAQHSLWDVFWTLKGLDDAYYAAKVLGEEVLAEEWSGLREGMLKSVNKSLLKVKEKTGIDYLPGSIEKADFDANATAIAFFPCELEDELPSDLLRSTFERYYKRELMPKLGQDNWQRACSSYELRNAVPYLIMGEKKKALQVVKFCFDHMYPFGWRMWGETIFGNIREHDYIGDMPHGWVSMIAVNVLRSFLVFEKDGTLHLCAGVPDEWFEEGFSFQNLPTYYGTVSVTVSVDNDKYSIEVNGSARPPAGLIMHLPGGKQVRVGALPWEFARTTKSG